MIRTLEQRLKDLPGEVILACVNYGYAASGVVENWATSVARVGLGDHRLIVTLDDRAQAVLSSSGLDACRWNSGRIQDPSEDAMPFTGDGWRGVTFSKLDLVHEVLRSGKDVLFSDADIVFNQNPLPFLRSLGTSMAVQSDVPAEGERDDDWSRGTLCSGFYFAKSCEETVRIFDPSRDDVAGFERDQLLLHHRLVTDREATTVILPRQIYPNGSYWRKKRPVDPHIIHYNWVSGLDRKIQQMKEDGNWWVDDGSNGSDATLEGSPDFPDKHAHSPTITSKLRKEIAEFSNDIQDASYLEIGIDRGYTLAAMAESFASLLGVEISHERVEETERLLEKHGITNATVFLGDSSMIPTGRYDVVLIDASHTYDDVKRDTLNVLSRIKIAGQTVIVFHDYGLVNAGVRQFCDEHFESFMIPIGEEADWSPLGGATDGPEAVACVFDRARQEECLARLLGKSPA